jgi:hypothetical protein
MDGACANPGPDAQAMGVRENREQVGRATTRFGEQRADMNDQLIAVTLVKERPRSHGRKQDQKASQPHGRQAPEEESFVSSSRLLTPIFPPTTLFLVDFQVVDFLRASWFDMTWSLRAQELGGPVETAGGRAGVGLCRGRGRRLRKAPPTSPQPIRSRAKAWIPPPR